MTVAVFVYQHFKTGSREDALWLQQLLQAMAQQQEAAKLIVYTNSAAAAQVRHSRIFFAEWKRPKWIAVRQRTLRLWYALAAEAGAQAVICVGVRSFTPGPVPQYLLLLPGDVVKQKTWAAIKGRAAAVWAGTRAEAQSLHTPGSPEVVLLPGGPLLPMPRGGNEDADNLKAQYTDGCEYFLYAGPLAPLPVFVSMLKAFSRFKHRQKSSWKLLLLPIGAAPDSVDEIKTALATYKYRSEVILAEEKTPDEAALFFTAAYAFVQPQPVPYYGFFLKEALCAGVPAIATGDAANKEIAGDAALYYESGDEQQLAECLMRVYKDEALRSRLAGAAASGAATFSWAQSAAAAWQSLAAPKK